MTIFELFVSRLFW